jgi:hypothetical protein
MQCSNWLRDIERLFIIGSGSSAVFGTVAGDMADCRCVICSCSCRAATAVGARFYVWFATARHN